MPATVPVVATALLLSWVAGSGSELAWNQFRGPGGRGVAPDQDVLPAVLDPETNRLWRCELPPGLSSPCIWGEKIFVTGYDEDQVHTLCVDRTSGSILWRQSLPAETLPRMHAISSPAAPTATTDGERVFLYFGTAASPVLVDGRLLFCSDSSKGSSLEAIDPATGETIWRRDRPGFGSGWSTPSAWKQGSVSEILVLGVWWLTSYSLVDGTERWSVPGLTDEPIVTPVTGEGLVFVSSYNMKSSHEAIGLPAFEELLAAHDENGNGSLDAEEADKNKSVLSRQDADGEGDHPLRIFFRFLDEDRDGEITAEEWKKLAS